MPPSTETPPSPSGFRTDLSTFNDSVDDVGQSTHEFLWKRHVVFYVSMLALTAFLEGLFLWLELGNVRAAALTENSTEGALVLLGLPFLIPLVIHFAVKARMKKLFCTQLAAALGFSYAPAVSMTTVSGHFFHLGNGQWISDVFSGTYRSVPARFYTYAFQTGSGKSREMHYYTVWEFSIGGALPEVLLKPRTSVFLLNVEADWQPPNSQLFTLEGDFSKYFDLYGPRGGATETLEIFQPDVMAKFMDEYKSFGFTCAADKAYVFRMGALGTNKANILSLLQLVDGLYDKVIPELMEVARSGAATAIPTAVN